MKGFSTLQTGDKCKKIYYQAPREKEWSAALMSDLKRKAPTLGWTADVDEDLKEAWPYKVRSGVQKLLTIKGTVTKGWTGLYEAKLPEPYVWLAYDAGFGAKNAQGFRMVGVVGNGKGGGKVA